MYIARQPRGRWFERSASFGWWMRHPLEKADRGIIILPSYRQTRETETEKEKERERARVCVWHVPGQKSCE
jgi:hypothetical protein